LLAIDAGYAVHEITARTEGDGFIGFGEEGTSPSDVDCEDISLLEFFKGGFGAKSCREPNAQVQISIRGCVGAEGSGPDGGECPILLFEDFGGVEHGVRGEDVVEAETDEMVWG
jgi:hypothetical protein